MNASEEWRIPTDEEAEVLRELIGKMVENNVRKDSVNFDPRVIDELKYKRLVGFYPNGDYYYVSPMAIPWLEVHDKMADERAKQEKENTAKQKAKKRLDRKATRRNWANRIWGLIASVIVLLVAAFINYKNGFINRIFDWIVGVLNTLR